MTEQFGPYRLDELIGRGGMGEVHRAFDTLRRRTVALKRLRPALIAEPEFEARFRAESELAARLRSAHVIPIHDYGEIDGRLFLDMRLVDGEDMGRRLARCSRLTPADAVHVVSQVAGALDAAHAAGLVHRDVKPSNVLLSDTDGQGGRDFAYLVDFGIAQAVDSAGLTASGRLVGTLDYMAPERFERRGRDHRADVYALACVLFEALTGRKPFTSHSVAGLLYCHVNSPPPRPSTLEPGVDPGFDAVIGRGMAKDPADRFPTAGALAEAARAVLQAEPERAVAPDPVAGSGPTEPDTVNLSRPDPRFGSGPTEPETVDLSRPDPGPVAVDPRPARTRRRLVAAGLVVALAAAAGVWLFGLLTAPATPPAPNPAVLRVAGLVSAIGARMVVDPSGRRIYVAEYASWRPGTRIHVASYDTGDSSLAGSIPVPDNAFEGMALSGDGRRLAVLTSTPPKPGADPAVRLSMIDLQDQTIVWNTTLPGWYGALKLSSDGSRGYLLRGTDLLIVDTRAGQVVATIPLGAPAQDLALTPDGRQLLITCSTGLRIVDPDRATVQRTVELRDGPSRLAVTADGQRALVLRSGAEALTTVDLTTGAVLGSIPVGRTPSDVALTADGRTALVSNREPGTVSEIDLGAGTVRTLSVGTQPRYVLISPDGRFGLVLTADGLVRLEWSAP